MKVIYHLTIVLPLEQKETHGRIVILKFFFRFGTSVLCILFVLLFATLAGQSGECPSVLRGVQATNFSLGWPCCADDEDDGGGDNEDDDNDGDDDDDGGNEILPLPPLGWSRARIMSYLYTNCGAHW